MVMWKSRYEIGCVIRRVTSESGCLWLLGDYVWQ